MEKKIEHILLISAITATLAFCLSACNGAKDPNDSKDVAEEHNEAKFDKTKEKDAQFLVDAAEIDLKEMKLSELAQTQAEATDIRDLAKTIMDDHSRSFKEIQALASKKMVTIPTELTANGQDAYNKIRDKSGKDFDREYSSLMVDGHKDAIDKFEKASADCEDYEIKTWAGKKLTTLRTHLDHSMECRDKYKEDQEKKPAHPIVKN